MAKPSRYQAVIASPIPGVPYLGITIEGGKLREIDFLHEDAQVVNATDELAQQCVVLLRGYFADPHQPLPEFHPAYGTPFQQRVWQQLQAIPAGEVASYGELAHKLNSSARAVASACRANPLAILIPCHRVIAANGLGGYMGQLEGEALAIKRWLLQHEGYV